MFIDISEPLCCSQTLQRPLLESLNLDSLILERIWNQVIPKSRTPKSRTPKSAMNHFSINKSEMMTWQLYPFKSIC